MLLPGKVRIREFQAKVLYVNHLVEIIVRNGQVELWLLPQTDDNKILTSVYHDFS